MLLDSDQHVSSIFVTSLAVKGKPRVVCSPARAVQNLAMRGEGMCPVCLLTSSDPSDQHFVCQALLRATPWVVPATRTFNTHPCLRATQTIQTRRTAQPVPVQWIRTPLLRLFLPFWESWFSARTCSCRPPVWLDSHGSGHG